MDKPWTLRCENCGAFKGKTHECKRPWNEGKPFLDGENNPRWKGGKSRQWGYKVTENLPDQCTKCGRTKNIVVHHKNRNPNDNRPENLEKICARCHTIGEHDAGYKIGHVPWCKGKKLTEEHKRKIGDGCRGGKCLYEITSEIRKKMSESHKGKIPWNKDKNHPKYLEWMEKLKQPRK